MDPPRRCPRDDPSSETALFENERSARPPGIHDLRTKLRKRLKKTESRRDPRTVDRLEKRFFEGKKTNTRAFGFLYIRTYFVHSRIGIFPVT